MRLPLSFGLRGLKGFGSALVIIILQYAGLPLQPLMLLQYLGNLEFIPRECSSN